jgi:hypothetical protein
LYLVNKSSAANTSRNAPSGDYIEFWLIYTGLESQTSTLPCCRSPGRPLDQRARFVHCQKHEPLKHRSGSSDS